MGCAWVGRCVIGFMRNPPDFEGYGLNIWWIRYPIKTAKAAPMLVLVGFSGATH
jgi:hypothetical protein